MNKKQSEKLGELFVKWNNREIDGDKAFYEVAHIFPRITMKAWRKSLKEKGLEQQ